MQVLQSVGKQTNSQATFGWPFLYLGVHCDRVGQVCRERDQTAV
nr:MAG TPA: hypothetical protein [Caudoviricetes sp.]